MTERPFKHLSPSALNAWAGFGSCQRAWFYERVLKLPQRPMGAPVLGGRVFDQALGAGYRHKLEHEGENPSPEMVQEVFVDQWRAEADAGNYDLTGRFEGKDSPQAATIRERGIDAAREHAERVMPRITPKSVQREVVIGFEEVDWPLRGWVDLVEVAEGGGVIVTDDKLTASTSKKFGPEEAANDIQLGTYTLGLRLDGEDVVGKGFRSARVLKTRHELGEGYVATSPEQEETTLDLVGMLAGQIEDACTTGVFLPTAFLAGSWKCGSKYCQWYASVCEFGAKARKSIPIPSGVAA